MNYDTQLTIATSVDVRGPANALALLLGELAEDVSTFREPQMQDLDGAEYCVSSTALPFERFARMGDPWGVGMTAPDHAPNMDLAEVGKALAVLDVWQGEGERPLPKPGRICAYITGRDAKARHLLGSMGLTRIPEQLEP